MTERNGISEWSKLAAVFVVPIIIFVYGYGTLNSNAEHISDRVNRLEGEVNKTKDEVTGIHFNQGKVIEKLDNLIDVLEKRDKRLENKIDRLDKDVRGITNPQRRP